MKDIEPFQNKVWLSTPTMHGEEIKYITEAYESNWMSTVGENINEVERLMAEKIGAKHAIALSSGTASLHLAIKLAGEKLYGKTKTGTNKDTIRRHGATDDEVTYVSVDFDIADRHYRCRRFTRRCIG